MKVSQASVLLGLWASVAAMAATGEASTQTASAVIVQVGFPYSASMQDVYNKPPLGQFTFNMRLCVRDEMPTWNGRKFLQFTLPSGETVYSEDLFKESIAPDPAGNKRCVSQVASPTPPANTPPSVQRAPQPAPNNVTPSGAGSGTVQGAVGGSLEGGMAAEKRGDWQAAFSLLEPLAEQGNPDAQTQLGFMYHSGKGVSQDNVKATQWYGKAALQGNAQAQDQVGVSYKYCCGPNPAAYAEAMKWFRKAADQGNADAQINLGSMYVDGKGGVPQNYAEAMKWYRKAADQGNATALSFVGALYANGQGVPQDYAEAMKWYRKAADQGDANAQKYVTRLSSEMAKSTVPDQPDPALPHPEMAQTALRFLKQQMTISTDLSGDPEPGLASIQSERGRVCRLRCGFHLASGLGNGGVDDAEIVFGLSDINTDTIHYNIDGIGRAFVLFGTSDGSSRFSRRDRDMDMKQNVLSDWSTWKGTDKGFCRAQPDKDSLQRVMKALAYLAESCGAKKLPF